MKMPNRNTKHFIVNQQTWQHRSRQRKQQLLLPNVVVSTSQSEYIWHDLYFYALAMSWPVFFGSIAVAFFLLNLVFALLFMLGHAPIANQFPPGFAGAFFFSVETLATVGYGDMHPQTLYAHIIATLEIFIGMCSIALMTGVIFARFSRPKSRLAFARSVVIGSQHDQMALEVRVANERHNVIGGVQARMWLILREMNAEGVMVPKLHELKLELDHYPVLMLYWTLIHVIDQSSPLHGQTAQTLAESEGSILLTLEGFDSTTTQSIHTGHAWLSEDILWQHRYIDNVPKEQDEGDVDYPPFDKTAPL
ncbi:ion channel [Neisseriaceae bacterium TC5R-5]|nr:ion channel [Neisseriaceae bacterium TC5R-5]